MVGEKKSILGLDIGFETLKLVELRKSGKDFELIGAVESPLTERLLEKDQFKDKELAVKAIKEACRKAKPHPISARKIVTALPETFVFSKTIKMPKMSDKDLYGAVMTEAAQYLPIPVAEVYIDFQVLMIHPDEPLTDILFVAAPKKLVDEYVEITRMAGFELMALETKPIAVGRAVIGNSSGKDATAIVEIGSEISRIAVWEDNTIRLASSVSIGANKIKETIESLDIGKSKKLSEESIKSLSIVLSPITDEVINAIRYHQNRDYKPKPITEIFVCGSGSKYPGVDQFIEQELKIKTVLVSPKIKKGEIGTEFVTAVGLAMRDDF